MIDIALSWNEVHLAACVGIARQIGCLRAGNPDRHGYEGDGWSVHIQGAAGEVAYAKVRNRFWGGTVGTFKQGGDVGDVQIRTRSNLDYDLIVRDDDRDGDVFVLVLGQIPRFKVVGWIRGRDAKKEEWRKTYGGREAAFFVPQESLAPF